MSDQHRVVYVVVFRLHKEQLEPIGQSVVVNELVAQAGAIVYVAAPPF